MVLPPGTLLTRSAYASMFERMGMVYVYHDLFGYLMEMTPDVARLLEAFAGPMTVDQALARLEDDFEPEQLDDFVSVFVSQSCLVNPGTDEREQVWEMYPMVGSWVLTHQSAPKRLKLVTTRRGKVQTEDLRVWEQHLWARINGDRSARTIFDEISALRAPGYRPPTEERFLETLARWVHHDQQYLRLSHYPLEMYRPVSFPMPPYLRSTMPFAPRRPGAPDEVPLVMRRVVSASRHYEHDGRRPGERFDVDETTLSHLFRAPGPWLQGRSYAGALVDALAARGALGPSGARVLEIGGGMGDLAAGVIEEIAARWPEAIDRLRYTILDLSPALGAQQRDRLRALPVQPEIRAADAETAALPEAAYDLIISNEMVGDLAVARLDREEAAALLAGDAPGDLSDEIAALLRRHPTVLAPEHLPDEFHLNVGAFSLIERAWTALAPGGWAFVSEFGEELSFPRLSSHLDHPEFSIHFGHLRAVAQDLGFEAELHLVLDLLGFQRDLMTLATTRGQFLSLRELARRRGARLDKRAYTPEALAQALGDALPLSSLGGLRFQPLEQRVMGLAPTDFKALLCRKPPKPLVKRGDV